MTRILIFLLCIMIYQLSRLSTVLEASVGQVPGIGAPFKKYADSFAKTGKLYGLNIRLNALTIRFGTPMGELDAQDKKQEMMLFASCTIYTADWSQPDIIVLKSWWDSAGDLDKEEVMFHEMGHCLLKQQHRDGMTNKGYKLSIMHRIHMGAAYYEPVRKYYLDELFEYGKKYVKPPVVLGVPVVPATRSMATQ